MNIPLHLGQKEQDGETCILKFKKKLHFLIAKCFCSLIVLTYFLRVPIILHQYNIYQSQHPHVSKKLESEIKRLQINSKSSTYHEKTNFGAYLAVGFFRKVQLPVPKQLCFLVTKDKLHPQQSSRMTQTNINVALSNACLIEKITQRIKDID